jgi:hypothetical protein
MTAAFAYESKWDRFNPIHDVPADEVHFDEYGAYLPTPQQIDEACRRIQEEWSLRERRKRYVGELGDLIWDLPVCRLQNAG